MKKLLFLMLASAFIIQAGFAQSVTDQAPVTNYDELAKPCVGCVFYPTTLYPSLTQHQSLQAALLLESDYVTTVYGPAVKAKIDNFLDRLVNKSQSIAKTKEGRAYFLGEYVSKISNLQSFYGNGNQTTMDIMHVINYIGYKLSLEIHTIVYGALINDVDALISHIEG